MRGFLRFVMTAAGLVLVAIAVAVLLLGSQAEKAACFALEKGLQSALGMPTELDRLKLRPLDQTIEVAGVRIGGDVTASGAFTCDSVRARLDPFSLVRGVWDIREIALEKPVLRIGQGSLATTALAGALLAAVARDDPSEPDGPFRPGVRVVPGDLTLADAVVEVESQGSVHRIDLASSTRPLPGSGTPVRPARAGLALLEGLLDAALEAQAPPWVLKAVQAERDRLAQPAKPQPEAERVH
jgi:uncharacterized protein involved in outer membrane biogenesis